jgi:hypothetical protein
MSLRYLRSSCLAIACSVVTQCLAGPSLSSSPAQTSGKHDCPHGQQTVAESNSGTENPQFGPAEELIVPLDFAEVETRLSDPAVIANQEPARLRLRLNNVRIYDAPAAGMRVFLDSPNAGASDFDAVPGYVESFAFFPMPTGTASGEQVGSFLIDLDEAVAKLAQASLLPPHGHTLTIIPIDGEGKPTGRVAVGSSEVLGS